MSKDHYISLAIKDKKGKETNLGDIIAKNKLSIILGTPGSGKTTLLKHYEEQNKGVKFLTIEEFLDFNVPIRKTVKILLLDGIDEYRAISQNKASAAMKIAHKINQTLSKNLNLKIVLTCREMDWFETDQGKLENRIKETVGIFYLQGLNKNQQIELAKLLDIENQDEFLKQFQDSNFLTNPQLFHMLAEIWKNSEYHFSSKREIYETFIKCAAKEKNETHKDKQKFLEDEEKLRLLGYLSYFYFFCGVDEFRKNILEQVASDGKGYASDKLKQLLKTNLFVDYKFRHKTIAEFALAYHIYYFKLKGGLYIEFERIKTLLVDNGSIPSKLRGAYAWLCSLSKDMRLIKIDPYYQAIYGDNGSFDIETKKKVLQAIKEYSRKNPYFINFSQRFELTGFYEQGLDKFLQSEYEEAIELNNHYMHFLNKIITQAHSLSSDMEEFIKERIRDNGISHYYKTDFLKYLGEKEDEGDKKFLKEVLDSIIDKEIDDERNLLKDLILSFLYPEIIEPKEVVRYLLSYEEINMISFQGMYLLEEVPFEDKKELAEEILQKRNQFSHSFYHSLDTFIKDFFLDAYLDETIDVETLYECLSSFKQNFYQYNQIEIKTFNQEKERKAKDKKQELQRKSNELFEINVQKNLKNEGFNWYLLNEFPYYFPPKNQSKVLLTELRRLNKDKEQKPSTKKNLFFAWINSLPQDKRGEEKCRQIANESGLKEDYENYLKAIQATEQEWEEWRKKNQAEREEKLRLELQENEDFFASKSQEEIINNFSAMHWIATFYLFRQSDVGQTITKETFGSCLEALRKILHLSSSPYGDDLLTIEALSKQSQNSMRNIDWIYYASLCLNEEMKLSLQIKDKLENFKKYLYIVALLNRPVINMPKIKFVKSLEEKEQDFALKTLKEYIGLLIDNNFKTPLNEIMKQHINKEKEIRELKTLTMLHEGIETFNRAFFKHFLDSYGLSQPLINQLKQPDVLSHIDEENKETIQALNDLHNDENNEFSIKKALEIFSTLEIVYAGSVEKFKNLNPDLKFKILRYFMKAFSNEKDLQEERSGLASVVSRKEECIHFLEFQALGCLKIEQLKEILKEFQGSIWEYPILHTINRQENKEEIPQHQIEKIKKMIFDGIPITQEMFFEEVYYRLHSLKENIEANENNEKKTYYNTKPERSSKSENEIRDIILSALKNKHEDIRWLKEEHQADNRVDISAEYREKSEFKIRIECKKDSHKKIIEGIEDQLIDKYLTSKTPFGIYLVFYFGEGEGEYGINELLRLLEDKIRDYQGRVKILLIDFTLPSNKIKTRVRN